VSAGSSYLVGERGPEMFVPRTSGSIYPNNALGTSGANVVVNVDASGSNVQGNGNQAKALGAAIGAAVRAELINQQRPGGLLA
jgi:phage-related minor tail protein